MADTTRISHVSVWVLLPDEPERGFHPSYVFLFLSCTVSVSTVTIHRRRVSLCGLRRG